MTDADLPRRRLWRRFAQDPAVRSDLARRLFVFVVEAWERGGDADVWLAYYARLLDSDATNVGRALDRLEVTGWLVTVERVSRPNHGVRLVVGPGPRWADDAGSRGRGAA